MLMTVHEKQKAILQAEILPICLQVVLSLRQEQSQKLFKCLYSEFSCLFQNGRYSGEKVAMSTEEK